MRRSKSFSRRDRSRIPPRNYSIFPLLTRRGIFAVYLESQCLTERGIWNDLAVEVHETMGSSSQVQRPDLSQAIVKLFSTSNYNVDVFVVE